LSHPGHACHRFVPHNDRCPKLTDMSEFVKGTHYPTGPTSISLFLTDWAGLVGVCVTTAAHADRRADVAPPSITNRFLSSLALGAGRPRHVWRPLNHHRPSERSSAIIQNTTA